ncbi:MAG: hypothetical protein JWQ87_5465 [Candidatus Sulfotelmatobacter sp.]|nr:hypothetical protein [Candidatus Sulfotelmatobacter sp.]
MLIVANGSPIPATVSGTNPTTYVPGGAAGSGAPQPTKLFSALINAPGSLRMDGSQAIVRASGNISAGVSTNTQFSLYVNYPTLVTGALQYPAANITAANTFNTAGTGIALFNANNNFVLGQYVSVTNVNAQYNAIIGPLSLANATAFGGFINGAAAVNASGGATVNTSAAGFATMLPQPLYSGANVSGVINVGGIGLFSGEVRLLGDQGSGLLTAYGTDNVVNVNLVSASNVNVYQSFTSTGVITPVPGVNFKNEPPFTLSIGETFGASNAGNTATLKSFYLEQ